jgi:hypothetical protein
MTTLTFQNVKHILAASLLSLGLVACDKGTQSTEKSADTTQTTSSIEQIKKNGVVRIGVFSDKPPFGYLDAQGKNQGFDVEIESGRRLGSPRVVEDDMFQPLRGCRECRFVWSEGAARESLSSFDLWLFLGLGRR